MGWSLMGSNLISLWVKTNTKPSCNKYNLKTLSLNEIEQILMCVFLNFFKMAEMLHFTPSTQQGGVKMSIKLYAFVLFWP